MESNFFRCLAGALGSELENRRIGKIFHPAPDVWTFRVQSTGGAVFLLLRTDPKSGGLFLTPHKPENPADPSAHCMWLRKRLSGRRIVGLVSDWPNRSLALELNKGEGRWLLLCLGKAPDVVDALPEGYGQEPDWPTAEEVLAERDIWRRFPQITPALRRMLSQNPLRAQAVLGAVERGGCTGFWVYEGRQPEALVWRLPDAGGRVEHVFDSALEAADFCGRPQVFSYLQALATSVERDQLENARRKLDKSLDNVARDRERLQGLVAKGHLGELLQSVLYQFDKDEKLPFVNVTNFEGEAQRVDLDRRLSVRANMERFFKLAAKGRRGLKFVVGRETELREALAEVDAGRLPAQGAVKIARTPAKSRREVNKSVAAPGSARFMSSDGFVLLRGKSAQANHDLVRKASSPFDLWFHVQGGAGSHVVLKRDFPDQHVPEASLLEAAGLAALRSYASGARSEVMVAQVRHVRAVKGAGPGKVMVDQLEQTLVVEPDPDLEQRLKAD